MNGKTVVETAIDAVRVNATDYDRSIAYLCSVLSTWSYASEHTLERVLRREHWWPTAPLVVEPLNISNPALLVDTNAYLVHFGGVHEGQLHVLAFRGTEPTKAVDWFTDALIEPHIWKDDQWVHRGFFLGLDVLWPDLKAKLKTLPGPLLITGHSLGGALAALCARRIHDELGRTVATYTFGQPMVGNEAFGEASGKSTLFRHVYNGDLVARLPPTPLGEGYQHYGIALRPGPEGSGTEVGRAGSCAWPSPCHAPDLPPAILSLLTARSPMVRELLEPLLFVSGLPSTVGSWLGDLAHLRKPERKPTCSIDDHMPTHYVDISRISALETGETGLESKRSQRWVAHGE